MKAINPTSGELIRTYEAHSEKGAEKIINSVDKAWQSWRSVPFRHRSALMLNMASLLRSERDRLALLITLEMGKVLRESKAEIEKCAWVCEYYAENAESFLQNEPIPTEFKQSYISFQPLGTILAVMPWNFPFWQVFRFAAPTLMAGNTVVLKHASNVPGCALAIEELFREAGFPDNAFRTLLIDGKKVESLIAHPAIKAVTLTGSTPAGRSVAAAAGRWLKKSVLELGGSDPYLILEDANLDEAATICAASRLLNAGQSCIAAKRFIVIENIFDEFSRLFTARMKEAVYGDPCHEETTLGPMARRELRDELHDQVIASVKQGAVILTGGMIPDQAGAFYPPTILSNVKPGMPAYQEELFGPVAALISARNEKQAVEIANDTSFGLGAAVFTRDAERGRWLAEEKIQAGSCFVNDMVKSDPRLPFGGINESGFGRELSVFGIREFVNIKTVAIR